MAEHDSTPEKVISKTQRYFKMGYISRRHENKHHMTTYYSQHPSLHLKGNWLAEAGFGTDTPVTVAVEYGQLLIRPVFE